VTYASTPPTPYPSAGTPVGDASVGELIGNVAADLSKLMRQELELAKAEMKVEVSKAGKGAGLLGGAGYAGLMLGIFASLTLMFLLDLATPLWVAALIVTALWAAAGAFLFTKGRDQLKSVNPTPTQTVNSLKETF
jgi:type IV secretory pathway TrbD component